MIIGYEKENVKYEEIYFSDAINLKWVVSEPIVSVTNICTYVI
jgi:hypothetical protein